MVALLCAAGCYEERPTLSSDVSTADMFMSIDVTGDGEGTHVKVALLGPGDTVELLDGDVLTVRTAGAEPHAMRWDGTAYLAELPPRAEQISLDLLRARPQKSASVEVDILPATVLRAPVSVSRNESLVLEWDPAAGEHTTVLQLSGECFGTVVRQLSADNGTYTIQPADLAATDGTCEVTATLTRQLYSSLNDGALDGAAANVLQIATATLESTP